MAQLSAEASAALRALVDEYRARCLWFLEPGYYPSSSDDAVRVLDAIQRYGDLDAFKRAGAIREWVSAPTSAASAGS